MKFGPNIAIFIIFFGVALVEALRVKNWLAVFIYVLLGMGFLYADNKKHKA